MNSGKSHQLVTNMKAEVLLSLDEENSSRPELVPCSSITRWGLSWAPSFLSDTSSDVERMLFASLERTLRGTAECFHQEMKAKKGIFFFFLTSVRCVRKRYSELSTIHIGQGIRPRKIHQPTWVLYRASEKGESDGCFGALHLPMEKREGTSMHGYQELSATTTEEFSQLASLDRDISTPSGALYVVFRDFICQWKAVS